MRAFAVAVTTGLTCLALSSAASATTITDDTTAPGTAIRQFPAANPEISFASPPNFGFTTGTPGSGVVSPDACGGAPVVERILTTTNTPPNAEELAPCGSTEFPSRGDFAVLTDFANSVSAFVGDPDAAGVSFELDAYDINQHLVARSTTTTTNAGITTPITVNTSGFTIAYFALYDTGGGTDHFIGMDDLSVNPCNPGTTCSPEISLSSSAGGLISQGASIDYKVSIVRHNGSNGNVNMSASNLPLGISHAFSPTPITGTNTASTFTVSADPTAPLGGGTGSITATPAAGAGSTTQFVPIALQVVAPFNLEVGLSSTVPSNTSISIPPCGSATADVRTLLNPGFTQSPVNLAVSTTGDTSDIFSIVLPKTSLNNPADFDLSGVNDQTLTVTRGSQNRPSPRFQIQITPTSGSFTEPAATIDVNRTRPTITSVNPTLVQTPQLANTGTEVAIKGSGFCPDSTVTFGNTDAVGIPDFVSSDRTLIRVRTPPLATDGALAVMSAGLTVNARQTIRVDSYRNVNGYQFHNYVPSITFDQMTEAFGHGSTYDTIDLCWPFGCNVDVRDPYAMLLNAIIDNLLGGTSGNGGACFGFALSTQRILEAQRPLSDFPPGNASTIFGLDGPGNARSGQITDFINALAASQVSNEFLGHYLSEVNTHTVEGGALASQQVFSEILDIFRQRSFPLIALRDGSTGHLVVAYNVQGGPPNWYIDVYDSNEPFLRNLFEKGFNNKQNEIAADGAFHQLQFNASRIHVDADGNWSLPSSSMSGGMGGLVVTDPASLPNPPSMLGTLSSLHEIGDFLFGSAGPPDPTGARRPGAPPSTVTQVTDGSGHTLLDARGNLNTDRRTRLPGAVFAPTVGPVAGRGRASSGNSPLILLPQSATNFHETVTDTGSGADSHTVIGRGFVAEIDTHTTAGGVDKLSLTPSGAGFATNVASKPLELTLIGTAGTGRRVAEVGTTSFNGAGDTLSFTRSRTSLQLIHHGPPTTFTLTLSGLDQRNAPEIFQSGALDIPRNGRVQIGGINWGSLSSSQIRVALGGRRLIVANRFRAPQLASIASLKARKLHKRTLLLTIVAQLKRLPRGAQVTFVWIVRRGGKKVASQFILEPPGRRSASLRFHAKRAGHYTLTAIVTVATLIGPAQSTSRTARTLSFTA